MAGQAEQPESLELRAAHLRAELRAGEPLPEWSAEQWVAVIVVKLGQAATLLHTDSHTPDPQLGIKLLIAVAVAALDAVESLEAQA